MIYEQLHQDDVFYCHSDDPKLSGDHYCDSYYKLNKMQQNIPVTDDELDFAVESCTVKQRRCSECQARLMKVSTSSLDSNKSSERATASKHPSDSPKKCAEDDALSAYIRNLEQIATENQHHMKSRSNDQPKQRGHINRYGNYTRLDEGEFDYMFDRSMKLRENTRPSSHGHTNTPVYNHMHEYMNNNALNRREYGSNQCDIPYNHHYQRGFHNYDYDYRNYMYGSAFTRSKYIPSVHSEDINAMRTEMIKLDALNIANADKTKKLENEFLAVRAEYEREYASVLRMFPRDSPEYILLTNVNSTLCMIESVGIEQAKFIQEQK